MIDSEDKRRSVQGYNFALVRPTPAGAITASDRAAVAGFYSGITYSEFVPDEEHPAILLAFI